MDSSPPSRPVTTIQSARTKSSGGSTNHAPPLRLLVGTEDQLRHEVEGLQAAFASSHHQLADWLERVEATLHGHTADAARAAMEELSFIRVGLRCIADAIGELDANVSALHQSLPEENRSA